MGVWIRRSDPVEKAWLDSSLREYDPTTTSRESRSTLEESEMNENQTRNDTLEEVAKEFDKMPFGDTAQSFATYVRDMKVCPPCHGNCNQGRTCPARDKCLISL
jgi:hypothetical protein